MYANVSRVNVAVLDDDPTGTQALSHAQVVCVPSETPYSPSRIAENPRVPGAPIALTDECYASEEEAQHAIFVRRLRDLGDPDVDHVLAQVA